MGGGVIVVWLLEFYVLATSMIKEMKERLFDLTMPLEHIDFLTISY